MSEIHESVTMGRLEEAMTSAGYIGFCTSCGGEQEGVEPDAEGCECESCGKRTVTGAEQLLLLGDVS